MAALTSAGELALSCPGRFDSLSLTPAGLPGGSLSPLRYGSCVHCTTLPYHTITNHPNLSL